MEAFTSSDADATALIEHLKQPLDMLREAEASAADQNVDADAKAFFDSLKVAQEGPRAVGTAVIPPAVLKKMMSDGQFINHEGH